MSKRTETCLTCQHYNRCKDPDKAFGYHCASYKTVAGTSASVLLDLIAEDTLTNSGGDSLPDSSLLMSEKRANKKESELIDYLDEVLTNPNPIPRDLKFDDSDLPEFKNFYHWANAKNGANTPPFARQLAIGIHLFAEYCPRCSHERFGNIYTVPYRASMEKIASQVTFLEYGKCPKCKVTKSELINRGELNLYDEFAGCLSADNLVSTDRGLIRIGDMNKSSKGLFVYTGNSNRKLENWFNKGVQKTYLLKSIKGYSVDATADHEIQVLDIKQGLVWKRLDQVAKSDYLTIGTTGRGATKKLKLDVTPVDVIKYSNRGVQASFPKYMNPKLAKILGYLISEGTITKSGSYFVNTNMELHNDISQCIRDQFSIEPRLVHISKPGTNGGYINGRQVVSTKDCYHTCLYNKQVNHWLHGMGLGVTAYDKFIPDIILQSDVESVKAFIAAYVDGDGSIRRDRINIWSRSLTLLSQFQSLLSSIGIVSSIYPDKYVLEVADTFGSKLYNMIEPYLIQKRGNYNTSRCTQYSCHGVPRQYIRNLLDSRKAPSYYNKRPVFINDDGVEVVVKGFRKFSCPNDTVYGKYVCYDDPKFDVELALLRKVSKHLYDAVRYLKESRFYFDPVASKRYSGTKPVYDIEVHKDHYLTANGLVVHNCIGQRGGKSAMFSLLAPYILHKYLKLQNPNRLYGQMDHTVLSGTFVGLTFARAMSLLWTPILNLIRTSEWFSEYHKILDFYGNKYDVVPYVIKDTFVEYRHRRLRLYPSGPNKRTLRGDTRFMSGIDEAGWFYSGDDDDEERERASGKEVHGALDRSLKTIRTASSAKIREGYDNLICGYNISISSPSHNKDLIMYLTGLYENSKECLAVRLPTWKFNPLYKGRDDFKKEYAENYARAERDFGVNPQVNENKVYSQDEVLEITQKCRGQNMVEISTVAYTQNEMAYTKPKVMRLVSNDVPSVLSLDAGETNNSFSLTLIQRLDEKSLPHVAAVIEVMPIKGSSINFNRMYEDLLVPILKAFNVCGVITDRWQSKAILTRISDEFSIYVKELSARPAHFTTFESYMRPDVLVTFPKMEMTPQDLFGPEGDYRKKFANKPVSHLMHQFNTIQELGGVYEKGIDNTDDSLRALVLGINLIMDTGFVAKYLKAKPRQVAQAVGAVGSMGFAGSGGGGMSYDPAQAANIGASSANLGGMSGADFGNLIASRGSRR